MRKIVLHHLIPESVKARVFAFFSVLGTYPDDLMPHSCEKGALPLKGFTGRALWWRCTTRCSRYCAYFLVLELHWNNSQKNNISICLECWRWEGLVGLSLTFRSTGREGHIYGFSYLPNRRRVRQTTHFRSWGENLMIVRSFCKVSISV